MEFSPSESTDGSVFPLPVSDSCQTEAGFQNQNSEDIDPEMYDFSSFLEGDMADDVFPEFKEMLKAASSRSSDVPKGVEEVVADRNMEHHIQPPLPPAAPQQMEPRIKVFPRASGSIKWTRALHASFMDAIKRLGGAFIATPKTVQDIMDVEGLSVQQVKSHLQKYRQGVQLCSDWRKFFKRGSSFSRAMGVMSQPAATSQAPKTKKKGKRKAKATRKENAFQQMKFEFFQRHLERLLEVQRRRKIAARRMAANQTTAGYGSAANQNIGGHPGAANQNVGRHPFAASQNFGGSVLQKYEGWSSSGMKNYRENRFNRKATMAPMPSYYPYQLNQYNASTSAAPVHAGMFVSHPPQPTQPSFPAMAASDSYQHGFNFDLDELNGIAEMTDEEFIESLMIDSDELIGDDSQDNL